MGSISMYRGPGQSDHDFFQAQLSPGRTILDSVTMRAGGDWRSVFYAAVEDRTGDTPTVWAFIVLINRPGGAHNFVYKEMDETVGPAQTTCPGRILDLLTPTEFTYAVDWRDRCRAHNAARAARPKTTPGDTIRFLSPIRFANGCQASRFQLVRRNVLRALPEDAFPFLVTVSCWRDRPYEKVES